MQLAVSSSCRVEIPPKMIAFCLALAWLLFGILFGALRVILPVLRDYHAIDIPARLREAESSRQAKQAGSVPTKPPMPKRVTFLVISGAQQRPTFPVETPSPRRTAFNLPNFAMLSRARRPALAVRQSNNAEPGRPQLFRLSSSRMAFTRDDSKRTSAAANELFMSSAGACSDVIDNSTKSCASSVTTTTSCEPLTPASDESINFERIPYSRQSSKPSFVRRMKLQMPKVLKGNKSPLEPLSVSLSPQSTSSPITPVMSRLPSTSGSIRPNRTNPYSPPYNAPMPIPGKRPFSRTLSSIGGIGASTRYSIAGDSGRKLHRSLNTEIQRRANTKPRHYSVDASDLRDRLSSLIEVDGRDP